MESACLDVLLVRHGLTDWNETGRLMGRADIALNVRGQAQAEALAEGLRDLPLTLVLASPQRRAQETAGAIARVRNLTVETEPALAEVWVGPWQGKTWEELRDNPDVQRYLQDATYTCDAIEPLAQVQERMVALVERLRAECTSRTVALVSHGDPLCLLVAHYLSMPWAQFRRLEITQGSVSVLHFDGDKSARLLVLNWRPQQGRAQLLF